MANKDHSLSYINRVMGLGPTFMTDLETNTQALNRAVVYEMLNCVDMAIKNGITFDMVLEKIKEEMNKFGVASYDPNLDPFGRTLRDVFEMDLGRAARDVKEGDSNSEITMDEIAHAEISGVKKLSKILWMERVIWLVRAADDSHKIHQDVFEFDISQAVVIARAVRDIMGVTIEELVGRYCLASNQTGEQALARPAVQRMVQVWADDTPSVIEAKGE